MSALLQDFVQKIKHFRARRFLRKILRKFRPVSALGPIEASAPVNFSPRNASAEKLREDVNYAVGIARNYLQYIQSSQIEAKNKVILEIGPGINFGSILVLACYGARVMASDRFLAPWDDGYHPKFYGLLRDWVKANMPEADTSGLDKILAEKAYPPNVIKLFSTSLEELNGIEDESIDVVFSNAVLEHIVSPPRSFQQLARVTRKGGLGFHQVDFRDHRDMSRPLEFLLMKDAEFGLEFEDRHGECGNRWRHWEYLDLFSQVGFELINFSPNIFADEIYLQSFTPRIRRTASRHRNVSADELRIVSGLITVKRI
jgi:SAM-dependent methyltransferase